MRLSEHYTLKEVYFSGDLHLQEELTFLSKINETEMVLKVFLDVK